MSITRRAAIAQLAGSATMYGTMGSATAKRAAAAIDALERALRRYVDSGERAGISWAVSLDGRFVSSGVHGYRDLASRAPLRPTTQFRIYSMTRAMTSVGALALLDRGRIALDEPIAKYLPEFANPVVLRPGAATGASTGAGARVETVPAERPILVRDLFTYTTGFGYAQDYPTSFALSSDDILGPKISTEEGMRRLAQLPLMEQPGTRWRYGWTGDVLGRLIEVVTGQRLDEYFARTLLDPLGMANSSFVTKPERLSRVYGPAPAQDPARAPLADARSTPAPRLLDLTDRALQLGSWLEPGRMHSGGGGLLSTSLDYLRFCEMLMGQGERAGVRILRPSTAAAMMTNQLTGTQGPLYWYQKNIAPEANLGLGWGYGIAVRGAPSPARPHARVGEVHWGGLAGTAYFLHPRLRLCAVSMTQYLGPTGDSPGETLREGAYAVAAQT